MPSDVNVLVDMEVKEVDCIVIEERLAGVNRVGGMVPPEPYVRLVTRCLFSPDTH